MGPVSILHDDEHLLVVNKPAFVLVVAAPGRNQPTLIDLLSQQCQQRLLAVHRLDEDTTGALVVARTEAGRAAMETLFRAHAVEREYLALCSAAPNPPAGTIESNLAEGPGGIVQVVQRGGERAVTHYETLERRERCTLVRCKLETGRRNQIRVHLAALGCPLAGDRKYGYRQRAGERFERVMLHSHRLTFRHPLLGTPIAVQVAPREPQLRP